MQKLRKTKDSPWVLVGGSKIQGRGVYAAKDIPEGTRIIEYTGERITKAESDRRAEAKESNAVYVFELNKRDDIDATRFGGDARYINHSCDENCETDVIRGKIWIIALRDIKKGEELTYDYNFDEEDYKDHPCKCGAKNCRKYIIGEDTWKKMQRKKKRLAKKRAEARKKK